MIDWVQNTRKSHSPSNYSNESTNFSGSFSVDRLTNVYIVVMSFHIRYLNSMNLICDCIT